MLVSSFLKILVSFIFMLILMCVNPKRIVNKGYKPYNLYTPPFVDAPCGHCWQCKLTRQNDYSFRVLHDMLSSSCIPFFVTLTYNDYYLPKLVYRLGTYEFDLSNHVRSFHDLVTLSVWNKQHVQRFNKRLRRQIQYYFGVDSQSFKYLITCERGSNREYLDSYGNLRIATNRPHFHGLYLLFLPQVPFPVRKLPTSFFDYCRINQLHPDFVSFFKYLLHKCWFYGNVDDVQYCRDIVSATRYITKYICKEVDETIFSVSPDSIQYLYDNDYNDRFKLAELKHHLGYSIRASRFPSKIELKDLCPRSFSSINLGMSFVEKCSPSELLSYCSGEKKVCLPSQNSSSMIMLPLYYVRKLTRFTKKCRVGSFYQRYDFVGNSETLDGDFTFRCKKNFRKPKSTPNWDNQTGYHVELNSPSYTETVISDFGNKVLRQRLISSFKRFKSSLSNYFLHKSFFDSVIKNFSVVSSDCSLLTFRSVVLSPSVFNSPSLLYDFVNYYHFFHKVYLDSPLFNIINFVKLCTQSEMSLKHLAFEKSYYENLNSSAMDNPDLFISHFI